MSDFLDVDGLRVGVNMVRDYREQISDLTARLAAAEDAINAALDALNDAPEINPSNYDHDQVCALNREVCYAFSVLNDHAAARGDE